MADSPSLSHEQVSQIIEALEKAKRQITEHIEEAEEAIRRAAQGVNPTDVNKQSVKS